MRIPITGAVYPYYPRPRNRTNQSRASPSPRFRLEEFNILDDHGPGAPIFGTRPDAPSREPRPIEFHAMIEAPGKAPIIRRMPEQPGDVRLTRADISRASAGLGHAPPTTSGDGLRHFARWYWWSTGPA